MGASQSLQGGALSGNLDEALSGGLDGLPDVPHVSVSHDTYA